MRKISIVGGGQCGMQVANTLLAKGYDITVVTNRSAAEIRAGKVLSSQCMFHTALQHERNVGLNDWEGKCPAVTGIDYSIADHQGRRAVHWAARLDHYSQSVDQRIKIPGWMDAFERNGGTLEIVDAGVAELEQYARKSDLTLVASGKGEIGKVFDRDGARCDFDAPMRALSLTYVHNMTPRPEFSAVCFSVIPGIGEYFVFPALTTSGPCEIMVFEGVIGGLMDRCWRDVRNAAEHLEVSKWVVKSWLPWEAQRCERIELTDDNGRLIGRFPPTVRKPVGTLPSGATVMGIGDTVVLNDPLTGQGSNNASKCAAIVVDAILTHGDREFDVGWMYETFERYWDYARWVAKWTNSLLVPPQEPIPQLMTAAMKYPELAREISNGFDNPPDFYPWFYDKEAAIEKLNRMAREA